MRGVPQARIRGDLRDHRVAAEEVGEQVPRIPRHRLVEVAIAAALLGVLLAGQITRIPWLVNTGFVILCLCFLAITVGQIMEAKQIRSLGSTRTPRVVL